MAEESKDLTNQLLPQRWLRLAAMIIAVFAMQFAMLIMVGIATYIMPEKGLTPAQFGMLANMPYLAGLLFGVLMGNAGDRFGTFKVMIAGIIVFIIGAFWRANADTYAMLMVSSLVMGFGVAVLNANSTKAIRLWFPNKAMGSAMGLYIAGASIGAGVAISMGAQWGTQLSLNIAAWLSVATLVLWLLLYRDHPAERHGGQAEAAAAAPAPTASFGQLMKNKYVWVVALMMMFVFGVTTTNQTYMTAGYSIIADGDMAAVSALALGSSIFVALASVIMPVFITRFKTLRGIMTVMCLVCAVSVVGPFLVPFGVPTWIMLFLCCFSAGAMLAMGKSVPALLPGIDPRNLGSVGGLQSMFQNLGGWLIPGYIIAPICQSIFPGQLVDGAMVFGLNTYTAIYFGATICAIAVMICYWLIPKNTPTHVPEGGAAQE